MTSYYENHCVKRVQIQSFFGPYFPAFGLNTERYRYRENSVFEHISHSEQCYDRYSTMMGKVSGVAQINKQDINHRGL